MEEPEKQELLRKSMNEIQSGLKLFQWWAKLRLASILLPIVGFTLICLIIGVMLLFSH
jgi:hypothetical protein